MKNFPVNIYGKVGKGTKVASFVEIGGVVGNDCKIQAFAFIPPGVTIGDRVFIGPHVCFTNDKRPPSDKLSETVVKYGASIGANATILPGITIGHDAMVGAGSVVTKDVPDGETWIGNPATRYEKIL